MVTPVSEKFASLSTHATGHLAVLAVLAVASQDQVNRLTFLLEGKDVLLRIVKERFGVVVIQKVLPFLQLKTLVSIAGSLQGQIVKIGCDRHGSLFLQEFFRLSIVNKEVVDVLLEEVMDSLSILAYDDVATWLVQEVVKLEGESSQVYLTRVAYWLVKNMQAVLMDAAGTSLARMLVQLLMSRMICGQVSRWSQILERLVSAMMNTMVVQDGEELPLLIVAAEHPCGHNVVLELAANKDCLVETKDRMVEMLNKHKTRLEVGPIGCLVVKGMQGWL